MEGDSSLQFKFTYFFLSIFFFFEKELKFKSCLTFSVPFYALPIKIDHQ